LEDEFPLKLSYFQGLLDVYQVSAAAASYSTAPSSVTLRRVHASPVGSSQDRVVQLSIRNEREELDAQNKRCPKNSRRGPPFWVKIEVFLGGNNHS